MRKTHFLIAEGVFLHMTSEKVVGRSFRSVSLGASGLLSPPTSPLVLKTHLLVATLTGPD